MMLNGLPGLASEIPIDPHDIDNDGDGYTENQGDCNDGDASIHHGADEIPDDGVNNNCNGQVDEVKRNILPCRST